jgi:hypothetical protein
MGKRKARGRPKAADITPPARPDFEALAKRQQIEGRDTSIFGGEVEIPVILRDQIIAYVAYLERHIDSKLIASPGLSRVQKRMIEIELAAWGADKKKDGRNRNWPFQPWRRVSALFPANFSVDQRTLGKWRGRADYKAAFFEAFSKEWVEFSQSPEGQKRRTETRQRLRQSGGGPTR